MLAVVATLSTCGPAGAAVVSGALVSGGVLVVDSADPPAVVVVAEVPSVVSLLPLEHAAATIDITTTSISIRNGVRRRRLGLMDLSSTDR